MNNIDLVLKEREEQLTKHGYSIEGDKQNNTNYQLVSAASILSIPDIDQKSMLEQMTHANNGIPYAPENWNTEIFYNMLAKPYKERVVIATSLLLAELDRITE